MMKFFEKYKIPLFIILCCICLLELCIILYNVGNKDVTAIPREVQNVYSFITAVICSIIASAVMLFLPNTVSKETIDNLDIIVKETIKNIQHGNFPMLYEDTNDPNIEFNNRLNGSIQASKNYVYFGDRGLYLTKRLGRQIVHHDSRLEISVFLADIRQDILFRSRESMYIKKEKSDTKPGKAIRSIDEIIMNEKMEVLRSLYALGKLSGKYEIHVYLHKEIPFVRFELTDSLMVMTFLTQWTSGKKYPATLVFENNDLFSTNYYDYAEQLKIRSEKLNIEDLSIEKLFVLAREAGLSDFGEEEITGYYEKSVK